MRKSMSTQPASPSLPHSIVDRLDQALVHLITVQNALQMIREQVDEALGRKPQFLFRWHPSEGKKRGLMVPMWHRDMQTGRLYEADNKSIFSVSGASRKTDESEQSLVALWLVTFGSIDQAISNQMRVAWGLEPVK